MSELKTKPNKVSVNKFLKIVKNEKKRDDSFKVLELMKKITKEEPVMWGPSIVGFGSYHYKYKSGREGDWFLTGFSPRKQNLTLYIMSGFKRYNELMKKLGKKQLTLHLQNPLDKIPDELTSQPLELVAEGNELIYTFDTQQEHTGIAGLLRRLNEHGIDFKDLHSSESSLEEIFVNLVREK